MKTIEEMIKVMEHFKNGGEVEFYSDFNKRWESSSTPQWNWRSTDYRIKEQKKAVIIEKWLISYDDGRYQILLGNEDFFKNSIHPQAKIRRLETYEVEI